MTNEDKLEKLKVWLEENGIPFILGPNRGMFSHSDLIIPAFSIFVKMEGDDDQVFYKNHKNHPFFIRSCEETDFIFEKMENLITTIIDTRSIIEQKRRESRRRRTRKYRRRKRLKAILLRRHRAMESRLRRERLSARVGQELEVPVKRKRVRFKISNQIPGHNNKSEQS